MPKNAEKYKCENCNFKCCKKSNYIKHIITTKHLKNTEKPMYSLLKLKF